MLKSQHNAWVHACATVAVVAGGLFWGISSSGWCRLILAMTAVWVAEAFNTAIEFLADAVSPQFHPLVKHSKDIGAGAVLISAIGALVVGWLVFGPHFARLIK